MERVGPPCVTWSSALPDGRFCSCEPITARTTLERCTTRDQQRARLATNRLEKLRELVASLLSAQRLKDAELTEDCCQIIWNNMLPLLEPRFYKEIEGILSACATALAKIDSNRNRLRVLLHLEFAKCQAASELLNNAATEIKKALALDYTLADSQLSEAQQVRSLLTHVAHISPSHAVRPTAVLAFCA